MADMAFRVIAAVSGIGVPVDRPVGPDLEGRISFLVEILAILGLDGGRIVRSVGNRSRRHQHESGYNQPNSTQELILDIRCRSTGAWNEPRAGPAGPALLRQREHGARA